MTRYAQLQRAATRLNSERAEAGIGFYSEGRGKKRIETFTPCPRSIVYIEAMSNSNPLEFVLQFAFLTDCECHSGISLNELRGYEYDDHNP